MRGAPVKNKRISDTGATVDPSAGTDFSIVMCGSVTTGKAALRSGPDEIAAETASSPTHQAGTRILIRYSVLGFVFPTPDRSPRAGPGRLPASARLAIVGLIQG
jgi:hypothetical protein